MVDLLRSLGVEYVALNPGATFRGLHDSLVNYGGNRQPEVILCCHEEIAVAVAHGYGKAAGTPMAAIVHDTVGLLHATMAVYIAWLDRAPLLLLGGTGPMAAEKRRPWIDWIHTALLPGNAVRDYVKWDDQPWSLAALPEAFLRAYRIALTEPQAPVFLALDAALQEEPVDRPASLPDSSRFPLPTSLHPDPAALRRVAEMLVTAEHPVVLADYVGRHPEAVMHLTALSDLLALPVSDRGSRFNVPSTHPLDLTGAEGELLAEADLVLALDLSDLQEALTTTDRTTRRPVSRVPPSARIVHITLQDLLVRGWSQEYGALYPVDLLLCADTSAALPALLPLCREALTAHPEARARCERRRRSLMARRQALRESWRAEAERRWDDKPITLPRLAAELWEVVKDEDWVLVNRTLHGWARRVWEWTAPYQYVGVSHGGSVGYGIGHSLGAALAQRSSRRLCIDIQPDGDLLYTPSGLWTAAHHRIPLLVVMYNNRSYYNDERHQKLIAESRGRPVENAGVGIRLDDPPIDFAGMARSLGIYGEGPIENPADLRPALTRAVRHVVREGTAALVDVITEPQ